MPDVIVVGAGVIGAALARYLARAGASVSVVDQDGVGDGTSSATFSVDITTRKTPHEYFSLSLSSAREHARLAAASGGDATWYHPAAVYEWGATDRDRAVIRERVARLQAWGYPAEWIDHAELIVAEPAIAIPSGEGAQIAAYPTGAWYDARAFALAMTADAARHGARILTGHAVTGLRRSGGRIGSVVTHTGTELAADVIVDCAGPAAARLAELAGLKVPLLRIPGLVATTEPITGPQLKSVIMLPSVNLRPTGGRRVVIHSYPVDASLPLNADGRHVAGCASDLLQHAQRILPGAQQRGLEHEAIGVRPVPPDGLPIVGFLDENFYIVSTHSGAHLAPILASLAAEEILGNRPPQALASFRPDRPTSVLRPTSAIDESLREMNLQLRGSSVTASSRTSTRPARPSPPRKHSASTVSDLPRRQGSLTIWNTPGGASTGPVFGEHDIVTTRYSAATSDRPRPEPVRTEGSADA